MAIDSDEEAAKHSNNNYQYQYHSCMIVQCN